MTKGFGQLSEALKKAKQVQANAARVQDELAEAIVEGSSGGGLVTVTMSGNQEPLSLVIKPDALKESPEFVEDLVLSAFKDAYNKSADLMKTKMSELTGGLSIPGLF
jgi:DNA-binding YbaB/EbfC family protein